MKQFKFDVFLSHSSRDKAVAGMIAERLRSQGLSVWFDDWMLKPGDSIGSKVEEGLEQSRTMVVCLSPAALASGWINLEHSTLAFRDASDGRRIVPLLIADCKIPDTLRNFQSIDFIQQSDAAFVDLLAACRPTLATKPARSEAGWPDVDETAFDPVRYVTAKAVLVGPSGSGKTSLAYRLIGDQFVPTYSTHGMQVWRLELPGLRDVKLERDVLLWDLAGQEDYRLIHQLFLDDAAAILFVIDSQKDDPFGEVEKWIDVLRRGSEETEPIRRAVRFLIFSRIDVGGLTHSGVEIDRFCKQHGFAGWLSTSAKTGQGCSELRRLIAENIPWNRLPWTATSRLLTAVKKAILGVRAESDVGLLRLVEVMQRVKKTLPSERFDESHVRAAVMLLANHGLVLPLNFGDLVLLRPELLSVYAGAIIRAARADVNEIGCVPEEDIYRPDFDFTGVERLKRPDEELLLRALIQTFLDHSLCIAEETPQGRQLVFPSQFRREKDMPKNPETFVSYTVSGEWQTIWSTLVVRLWYSQEFARRELWRNAAEFAFTDGHTLGLQIQKDRDGTATINLYFDRRVSDEVKGVFVEYVHRHLAQYAGTVVRDRRYVCPNCAKPVMDFDAVQKRIAAGKDFIICQQCDERVPLVDFIEHRLKGDPVGRKILAMDEKSTRALDAQALQQILIGHVMAVIGEAKQIFRLVSMSDHGIDGEVEFIDDTGKASGRKIYIQLKSGNSYLSTRKRNGREVFDVKDDRQFEWWINQPVDVYLVIRQTDEVSGQEVIRWMNVTRYLKTRKDKTSRQIVFDGEKLDMEAVCKVRDGFFPPTQN